MASKSKPRGRCRGAGTGSAAAPTSEDEKLDSRLGGSVTRGAWAVLLLGLTATRGGESGAAWSPDGRRLAFSARREGDEAPQDYVLDVASGGEAQRVTTLSTGARSPQWSPDGSMLLYAGAVYPGAVADSANRRIAAERRQQPYRARVYDGFPIRNWDRWLDDLRQTLSCSAPSRARRRPTC